MSTIILKVNGTDKTDQIKWESLKKRSALTRQPDSLSFALLNYPTKTWRPVIGDEVTLFDDALKIFGGVVTETDDELRGGLLKTFTVTCKDYSQLLDRNLVSKNYTNMTAAAIISDIISTYTTGFTTTNVVAPDIINAITFNYLSVTQSLQKLTEMLPGYDYYVDYNKDIHFFLSGSITAPYALTDTSANFIYQSLVMEQDNTQIRNFITVRGGLTAGTAVDNKQITDGQQRVFFVGYNLSTFLAYKALAASPTTFVALTIGRDGIDDPTSFDALYNPDRGLVTFPDASKPAINDVFKYTGIPMFPLVTQQQDALSVATYGIYQYVIVDKTITTKTAASQRAQAELILYANPNTKISFSTQTSGLVVGQTISIICPLRGISGSYKISKMIMRLHTPSEVTSDLMFDVECVSALSIDLIDLLNKLLVKDPADQISIGTNEVVDRIYTFPETITISEVVTVSKVHNPIFETITITESFTNNGLNFGTIFVAGPWPPSTTKRVFVLDGSILG